MNFEVGFEFLPTRQDNELFQYIVWSVNIEAAWNQSVTCWEPTAVALQKGSLPKDQISCISSPT